MKQPLVNISSILPTTVQILNGQKPANTDAVRSQFEPGLKFEYSGGGTTISQLIVMDVAGQAYDKYMKDNVLEPLGMRASFYTQPPPPGKNLATGYRPNGTAIEGDFMVHTGQLKLDLFAEETNKFFLKVVDAQLEFVASADGKIEKVILHQNGQHVDGKKIK